MEQLTFDQIAADDARATCACGCGIPTTIAKRTNTRDGTVKGKPTRYIKGHSHRRRIDDDGRECSTCGEYKPWDEYWASRNSTRGRSTACIPCAKKARTVKGAGNARTRADDQGRECTKCGTYRPWAEYNAWKVGFNGHDSMCKTCKRGRSRADWASARARHATDSHQVPTAGCKESRAKYTEVIPLHYGIYVYRCWTADDRCIYVGQTIHVIRRMRDHVTVSWWEDVHHLDVAVVASLEDADAEEMAQIRHWRPINNSAFNRTYARKSTKPQPTHCPQEHEYTPENTIYNLKGSKICRQCKNTKARTARPAKGIARGEQQGSAKLTGWAVADIRRRHARGDTISAIARDYGVSRATIRRAVTGKTWMHVKGEAA